MTDHSITMANLGINPDRRPDVRVMMGQKKPGGGVVGKGRFWLGEFSAGGSGMNAVRELHPAFAAFNVDAAAKVSGKDAILKANRPFRTLWGVLLHSDWMQPRYLGPGNCHTEYSAQKLPRTGSPPGGRAACSGNGVTARRWNGHDFAEIRCPGDRCEFRQYKTDSRGNETMDCKRASTLVFQLRWPETNEVARTFPNCAAMISSKGPYSYTTDQWWGVYQHVVEQWDRLGLPGDPDFSYLPIRFHLARRTVQARRAEVWVPELHLDFGPGETLQGWLLQRAQLRAQLGEAVAAQRLLALPAPVDIMGAEEAADAVYDVLDAEAYEMPRGGK